MLSSGSPPPTPGNSPCCLIVFSGDDRYILLASPAPIVPCNSASQDTFQRVPAGATAASAAALIFAIVALAAGLRTLPLAIEEGSATCVGPVRVIDSMISGE